MSRKYCLRGRRRTTLNIEDDLLTRAEVLTGIKEKTALVRLGLEALIARESARRLAALGGSEKELEKASRREREHQEQTRRRDALRFPALPAPSSVWVGHCRHKNCPQGA
jgi:Arc/MetJ family transcription regulator